MNAKWITIGFEMEDCVFCQIVAGKIPAQVVYQDEIVLMFKDIKPLKPVHLLVIPKRHVTDFTLAQDGEISALRKVLLDKITELKLLEKGYRLEINGGAAMGVPHLHIHLLAPIGVAEPV
jgi:histidine triad (HIT) family protein